MEDFDRKIFDLVMFELVIRWKEYIRSVIIDLAMEKHVEKISRFIPRARRTGERVRFCDYRCMAYWRIALPGR